jgi:hypothetical protein
MKKYILALLFALSTSAFAEPVAIYIGSVGGPLEVLCRAMSQQYEKDHGDTVAFYPMAGLDNIVAIKAMLQNTTTPTKMLCHGSSAVVQNQFVHAGIEHYTQDLYPIIKWADAPIVFYTNNSAPAFANLKQTMDYYRGLNRPINVGVYLGYQKVVVADLARQYKVPLVSIPFKRATDFFPTLSDNSLDMAMDVGGGLSVAESGKFKALGYIALKDVPTMKSYKNLVNEKADFKQYASYNAVSVPRDMPEAQRTQLTARLVKIFNSAEQRQLAESNVQVTNVLEGDALKKFVKDQVDFTRELWLQVK